MCVWVCVSDGLFVCLGVGLMGEGFNLQWELKKQSIQTQRDVRGQRLCQNIKHRSEVAGGKTVVVSFSRRETMPLQQSGFCFAYLSTT